MSISIEQLKAETMRLSPEARADLAHWLLANVEPSESIKAAWNTEIARRLAEIEDGNLALTSGDEVFAKIDKKLRETGV